MSIRINSEAPNFTADTTQGKINFHEWIGNGWAILFSHPKDFTPVCTTELGYMAGLQPEFAKRNTKIIGLSVDPVTNHGKWAADIEETQGHKVNYPMIGDPELKIAKLYDMLPAEAGDSCEGRTAADNATVRNVFVIGPDKKIKLMLVYPMSSGRNFDEVLRVLDSLQLNAKHNVATPVNWKPGVQDAEAVSSYSGAAEVVPFESRSDAGWKFVHRNTWRASLADRLAHPTRRASPTGKRDHSRCRRLSMHNESRRLSERVRSFRMFPLRFPKAIASG